MTLGTLTIEMARGGWASVYLDGERLRGVAAVSVECAAGQPMTAVLRLQLADGEAQGTGRVELSEGQEETLKRLGWTPPPDRL